MPHFFWKSTVSNAAIVNKCHIKTSGHRMVFVHQQPTETKAYMEKSGVSSQLLNY